MDLPEILSHVAICLEADQRSLSNASLTCRRFRNAFQPVLFRTFTCPSAKCSERLSLFARACQTSPYLAKQLRDFNVVLEVTFSEDSGKALEAIHMVLQSAGNIQTLRLTNLPARGAANDLLQTLAKFKHLKTLYLAYACLVRASGGQYDVASTDPVMSSLCKGNFRLKDLRMAGMSSDDKTVFKVLPFDSETLKHLRRLSLSSVGLSDGQLLAMIGHLANLRELSISSIEESAHLVNPVRRVLGQGASLCCPTSDGLLLTIQMVIERLELFRLNVSALTFDEADLQRLFELIKIGRYLKTLAIEAQGIAMPFDCMTRLPSGVGDFYVCAELDFSAYAPRDAEKSQFDYLIMLSKWIHKMDVASKLRVLRLNERKLSTATQRESFESLKAVCQSKCIDVVIESRGYARHW